jgi:hypothetical protein
LEKLEEGTVNEKTILGRIDCPSCGYKDGMRVTHDKNSNPFGYCDASCGQQLRIGGDPRRVRDFIARHPWAAGVEKQEKISVTVTENTQPENQVKGKGKFTDALGVLGA